MSSTNWFEFYRCMIGIKHGHQETDAPLSAVTTKVKGVLYTNFSAMFGMNVTGENLKQLDGRVWDAADYVNPSQVCLTIECL